MSFICSSDDNFLLNMVDFSTEHFNFSVRSLNFLPLNCYLLLELAHLAFIRLTFRAQLCQLLFQTVACLLWLSHFPNCQRDQYAIEENDLNKVVYTFVEGCFVWKRLDVEIDFISFSSCNPTVQINFKTMGALAALAYETMHEHKSV